MLIVTIINDKITTTTIKSKINIFKQPIKMCDFTDLTSSVSSTRIKTTTNEQF